MLLDALASVIYPGLTAVSVFWASVGVARFVSARRFSDFLMIALSLSAALSFFLLSVSTGLFRLVEFQEIILLVRSGWAITLFWALWFSAEYLRRQYAFYQKKQPGK